MKNIIPFQKELSFDTKVSEITSISLEREYEVKEGEITGFLIVSGEYKSHEISANVIPFTFKIPFTIDIPKNLQTNTISLEISDFAYDMLSNNKMKVSVELELEGEFLEEEEEMVEEQKELPEVDAEEVLSLLEDRQEEVMPEFAEEQQEENTEEEQEEPYVEEEQMILNQVTKENEYVTYHIHVIKEEDTLESVCSKYQTSEEMLKSINDLSSWTPGDRLLIPLNNE